MRLRKMDIDDLYIMRALADGKTMREVAKMIGVTQPAITQRVSRMSLIFGGYLTCRQGRLSFLSPLGVMVARSAKDALAVLESCFEGENETRN